MVVEEKVNAVHKSVNEHKKSVLYKSNTCDLCIRPCFRLLNTTIHNLLILLLDNNIKHRLLQCF